MKAIVLREFGGPEGPKLEDIPAPDPDPGGVHPPIVDRVLPLSAAVEAHRLIERRAVAGKVLLDPTRT